jgi:cytoskeletal protein CcmA (bactofilin family)
MHSPLSPRRWLAALAIACAVLLPSAAVRAGSEDGDDGRVTVPAETTHDGNLYAFGDEVLIDGLVTGDVVGAAKTVRIGPDGQVNGDVLAAAYAVEVLGTVDGDVRAAAYMVEVGPTGSVGGEVAAVAYSVDVDSGGRVASDLLSGGYQLLVDGTVGHDVRFAGAALVINGTVEGDVHAYVSGAEAKARQPFVFSFNEDVPQPRTVAEPGLMVGEDATIGGTLVYTSTAEAALPGAAQLGGVTFNQTVEPVDAAREQKPMAWWQRALRIYAALLIVGFLLLWLAPRAMKPAVAALRSRPLPAFGYGLVAAVGDVAAIVALTIAFVLVLALVAVLTLGGQLAWPAVSLFVVLAVLLTFGFMLLLLVGTLVSAQSLGQLIVRAQAESSLGRRVGALLVGAAIVAALLALPAGLGTLFGLIAGLFGLGGLALAWLGQRHPPTPMEARLATPLPGDM